MDYMRIIDDLRESMAEFFSALEEKAFKNYGNVPHAEESDTLDKKTPNQVIELLDQEVTEHTSALGQNVHGLTPASINTYSTDELEDMYDTLMDVDSGLPISFYGTADYFPPPVSSMFESGSIHRQACFNALFMEDTGTLAWLRVGTDGSTSGVYYSYLHNARTAPLNSHVHTNTRYEPSFIPSNLYPCRIGGGCKEVIIGDLKVRGTNADAGYFISILNGTLEQSGHTGCVIPRGVMTDTVIVGPEVFNDKIAWIHDDRVWIGIFNQQHITHVIGMEVWSVPLSSVQAGNYSGLRRETGWTINRGPAGTLTNQQDILIANSSRELFNFTGKEVRSIINGHSRTAYFVDKVDGKTRLFLCLFHQFGPSDGLGAWEHHPLTFDIDFRSDKVIDVSKYFSDKPTVDYTGLTIKLTKYGPLFSQEQATKHVWRNAEFAGHQVFSSFYLDEAGHAFSVHQHRVNGAAYILRQIYDMSKYTYEQVLTCKAEAPRTEGSDMNFNFPTPVTYQTTGLTPIGDGAVLFRNTIPSLGGVYSGWGRNIGGLSFLHPSIKGIPRYGFQPTSERALVKDKNPSLGNIMYAGLCETYGSQYVTSTMRFIHPTPLRMFKKITTEGVFQNEQQIRSDTVKASLLSQIKTIGQSKGTPVPTYNPNTDRLDNFVGFDLIIPQLGVGMPNFIVFCIASGAASSRKDYFYVAKANVTYTRDVITAVTIDTASVVSLGTMSAYLLQGIIGNSTTCGAVAIRRVGSTFMIGYGAPYLRRFSGDAHHTVFALKYENNEFSTRYGPVAATSAAFPFQWVNYPTHGMFLAICDGMNYDVDSATKTVGSLYCKDSIPSANRISECVNEILTANGKVLLTQAASTEWVIYFTEPVSAMIDGKYGTIEPYTYQMDKTTDGNSVFHVWVGLVSGALQYIIRKNDASKPGVPCLYIGNFRTNNLGVSEINVKKAVAIDGMTISTRSGGSSIPVSGGSPAITGKLNWV